MKILYLGDIVGEKSIKALEYTLNDIKKEYGINVVLANAENVTKGKGLCENDYKALKRLGIQAMSMGNHTFSKREIKNYIDEANICRPANLNTTVGKGYLNIKYNDKTICLVNLLGRVYMNGAIDCPFQAMDKILENVKADYYIVDFHAEATSEKKAFFYDFAGKVSAVVGTHTHTQTADEQVYKNTCFISDIGMCGPYDSILGDDIDKIIERFRTGIYDLCDVSSSNDYMINGVVIDLGITKNTITRIHKRIKL